MDDLENPCCICAPSCNCEKPVIALAAIGETPMSPVMVVPGVVEMPALLRMEKSPAVYRFTDPRAGEG
jgi:hypothetical protein